MQLISSLAGLLAGLVAANPLPASDSGPALAIASTPYVLGINATVGQHDTADGIIELCPQPDYKGDCFSWGYNQSMCCSYTRPPIVYVRQFTDEPVAADAFVGDVAIQSAVTLDLGQSGSSQCTLFSGDACGGDQVVSLDWHGVSDIAEAGPWKSVACQ